MAEDGPTSPADSPAYQRADDDTAPVPVASTIFSNQNSGLNNPYGVRPLLPHAWVVRSPMRSGFRAARRPARIAASTRPLRS